jgi:glycosyltransferase involved in cell wall biosynthesis
VIQGFQRNGWEVHPYILGDQAQRWASRPVSEWLATGGGLRTRAADVVRLCLRPLTPTFARLRLGTDFDWVYERYSVMQCLGAPFQRRGVPWVLETNSPAASEAYRERRSLHLVDLASRMERHAYQACDVLVCVSARLKALLLQEMKLPEAKVIVAPVGVDPEFFNPSSVDAIANHKELTIGFVGRLYRWQGLDTLFRAAGIARTRGAPALRIIVVGGGISEREFKVAAETAGPGVAVEFVGHVSSEGVRGHIAGFDVAFVGPRSLGTHGMYFSPVKLLEYMAMAKPVLCAGHDSLAELIQDGVTGFLFEPENPESLAQAILNAIEAGPRLPEFGRTARQIALQNHTWDLRVATMIEQIDSILSRPNLSARALLD